MVGARVRLDSKLRGKSRMPYREKHTNDLDVRAKAPEEERDRFWRHKPDQSEPCGADRLLLRCGQR
jgi:hypothetical protein